MNYKDFINTNLQNEEFLSIVIFRFKKTIAK